MGSSDNITNNDVIFVLFFDATDSLTHISQLKKGTNIAGNKVNFFVHDNGSDAVALIAEELEGFFVSHWRFLLGARQGYRNALRETSIQVSRGSRKERLP